MTLTICSKLATVQVILAFLSCCLPAFDLYSQTLQSQFRNPPMEAKPRGYWIWAHGNFDYATIDHELKEFKEKGMGGADIFDMGIADPLDIIPAGNTFMGDPMVDGIVYALEEAKRLGLSMGLSVSNGWNAGGDWTAQDEKLMRLLFWSDTLTGPLEISQIGFPEVPRTFEKPYGSYELFPEFDTEGFPVYYENVALQAYPLDPSGIIKETAEVISFPLDRIRGNQTPVELPAGRWVLTRAVVTPLGQRMWMRSDNSNGYIMDHYSEKATKNHFNYIIDKLEHRLGNLGESSLERLYLASFEAEDYVIWSPELKQTFYQHHGYAIDPYLPVFSGAVVVDQETTNRFLHDYRTTVSEMFVNNHYRQASEISRAHGVLVASESGGPGPPLHYVPTEDLKALGAVDIMRGEFWNNPKRWDDRNGNNLLQVVKNIASAAHVYGHKVVEMEAFTSQRKHWEETPWELKKLADRAFCEGMTRVVYHTMPHSPPQAGVPGWSYQAGTHIHPKMTWWPMIEDFNHYLARCGTLLMHGNFVADVAYYKGGEVPNFSTTKYIRPDLGFGYDYDDINSEVLMQTTQVRDGNIVLPSGMEYKLLVLPESEKMELEVLKKIEELVSKGAKVIGPKPLQVHGLSNYKAEEEQLAVLANRVWGKSVPKRLNRKYGQGKIIYGLTAREVLEDMEVVPDIQVSPGENEKHLDFIHRKSADYQVYFIRNKDSLARNMEVSFRVSGRKPEFWYPGSGEMQPVIHYRAESSGITIPMHLPAYASVFVVFSGEDKQQPTVTEIQRNGRSIFPEVSTIQPGVFFHHMDQDLVLTTETPGSYRITMSSGETKQLDLDSPLKKFPISTPWEVHFPAGWRVPTTQEFDQLSDWTQMDDIDLKHFSGTATYKTSFELGSEDLQGNFHWVLDLGRVGAVAKVYLNGKNLGSSLFPEHRLSTTDHLVEGENFLVIEVANTWKNRMILDASLPGDQQLTRSNLAQSEDPMDRMWKNKPLQPSGLMGPVELCRYQIIVLD